MLPKEKSQSDMATHCMILIICHSGKSKTMETVKKISSCQGLWGGRVVEGCLILRNSLATCIGERDMALIKATRILV